ncbi:MAG: hypothetical protein IPM79_20390 [Polyangiaceae bacterium]|nr:hypothetical protein [Polyangiaceae bacterium]
MRARRLALAACTGVALSAAFVLSLSAIAPTPAAADQTASDVVTCQESIPKGAKRPKLKEKMPGEVVAGFEAPLEIEIRHGKGETPLPSGFKLLPGSPTKKFVEEAGFILAEPDGSTGVVVETKDEGTVAVTRVKIPFVVAPKKSGKQSLTLPQVPLAIDRANGDKMIVCTQLHLLTALDPTAGEEDPKPRPNPAGRPQIEAWELMKYLAWGLLALLLLAAIIAWWVRRQLKKPVPAPPPERRLPWEAALGELAALGASPLLDEAESAGPKRSEHFDKVSDTLRKYLGARYGFEDLGFDGLETTTDEMMGLLKRVRPHVPSLELIETFLSECDLVKFARVVPATADCRLALERAEKVVRATIPIMPAPGAPVQGGPLARLAPDSLPGDPRGAPTPIVLGPRPGGPPQQGVPAPAHKTELGPSPIAQPLAIPTVINRTVPGAPLAPSAPLEPKTLVDSPAALELQTIIDPPMPPDAQTIIDPPTPLGAQTIIDPPTPLDPPSFEEPPDAVASPAAEVAPAPARAIPVPVPVPHSLPAPVPIPNPVPAPVPVPNPVPAPTPAEAQTPAPAAFVIPGRHAPDKPPEDPRT